MNHRMNVVNGLIEKCVPASWKIENTKQKGNYLYLTISKENNNNILINYNITTNNACIRHTSSRGFIKISTNLKRTIHEYIDEHLFEYACLYEILKQHNKNKELVGTISELNTEKKISNEIAKNTIDHIKTLKEEIQKLEKEIKILKENNTSIFSKLKVYISSYMHKEE